YRALRAGAILREQARDENAVSAEQSRFELTRILRLSGSARCKQVVVEKSAKRRNGGVGIACRRVRELRIRKSPWRRGDREPLFGGVVGVGHAGNRIERVIRRSVVEA